MTARRCSSHGEHQITDDEFSQAFIVSSEPDDHAERVREIEGSAPTRLFSRNGSSTAPVEALDVYEQEDSCRVRSGRTVTDDDELAVLPKE